MNAYSVYITKDSQQFFAVKNGKVFISGNGGQTYRTTDHKVKAIISSADYSHSQLLINVIEA